ncbi:MAG: hypothetical protein IKS20_04405 [Victivallales bacterium]|nr:hypothetical protein [Victivallales bacterium]
MKKLFFFLLVLVASMAFTKETSPDFAPMMIGAKGWAADAKPLVGDNKGTVLVAITVKKTPDVKSKMLPLFHLRTASRLYVGYTYYAGGKLQFSFTDRDKTFRYDFSEAPQMLEGRDMKLGMTWDGALVRLYKDGRMIASAAQPLPLNMGKLRNLCIGPYKDGWYVHAPWNEDVQINSLRTFDEALSPEEIAKEYAVAFKPLAETHPMLISIPPVPAKMAKPEIDGKLNDKCWNFAGSMPHLIRGNMPRKSGQLPPHTFMLCHDEKNLYLGFTSLFPGRVPIQEGALRTPAKEPEAWGTESFEFYIHANGHYYRFAGNVAGGYTEWKDNAAEYNVPWTYRTSKSMNIDDSILWQGEVAIPWSSIELQGPPKEAEINFCRSWKLPECGVHSSMNITGDVYSGKDGNLIKAVFAPAATFQMREQSNPSSGEYVQKFTIATPVNSTVTYDLAMARLDGSAAPMSIYNRKWSVKGGEILTDNLTSTISSADYDALLYTFKQGDKVVMREIMPFELNDDFFNVTSLLLQEKILISLKQNMLRLKKGSSFQGEVQLLAPNGKKTVYPATEDTLTIPFKRSEPAGKYTISLVDKADGKAMDSKVLNYPGIGEWEHQDFQPERIIPPFTPMKNQASANRLQVEVCNGRKYVWENALLPTQIEANGEELLLAPVELLVGDEKAGTSGMNIASTKEHRAEFGAKASVDGASLASKSWIEYDGIQMNYVTVTPQKQLNSLKLRFTMPARYAKYVHGASGGGWGSKTTSAVANGTTKVRYYPCFWLGDEEKGLCFFCETRSAWNEREQNAYTIEKDGDKAVVTISIMSKVPAGKPLELEFGFIATPVRPLASNYPFDTLSWSYIAPMNRPGRRPTSDIVILTGYNGGDLGSFFGDIDDNDGRKEEQAKKDTLEKICKGHNVRPIPYTCARNLSIKYPETAAYINEWTFKPMNEMDYTHTGHFVYDCCPRTSANDFFIWKYKQLLKRLPDIKGIYFDFGGVNECSNEVHGCNARTPLLAQREFYRRIALAQLEAGIKEPVLVVHNTDKVELPAYTFATHLLNGEQVRQASSTLLHNKKDILDSYGIDIFASELGTLPWGITNSVYMPIDRLNPKYGGDEEDAPYKFRMDKAIFAATLIHNTIPCLWRNHLGMFDKLIRIYDRFGVDKADFIGYWKEPAKVEGAKDIYVSCFVSKDRKKLLAVVGHVGKEHVNQDFTITFDLNKLGLKARLKNAVDTMPAPDPEYQELFELQKKYKVPPVRGPILMDQANFGSKVNGFNGKTLKMHLDFHCFAIVEME